MRFDTTEATWYEDGALLEFYTGEGRPQDKECRKCSLEEAIQFVWENKMCLYIQPELEDAGLFVDYTG